MISYSFLEWAAEREKTEKSEHDPFITMQQKHGDHAYFGVHDLSQHYRKTGSFPALELGHIEGKSGRIVDADPVDQTVTIRSHKAPFHYGYHKLEDAKSKEKRKKMAADPAKGIDVKIPTSHLQDISHLFGDNGLGNKIWIVIDGNTKYQQNLMREIRKKEVDRQKAKDNPQYDLIHSDDEPESLEIDDNRKYMLKNREVIPTFEDTYWVAPGQPKFASYWKTYFDPKFYEYYPE